MTSAKSGENCIQVVSKESRPSASDIAVNLEGCVPFLAKPQLLDTIMCRQIIAPRCKLGLKFRVTRANQELRWRFRALKGKMTFTIYRQKISTINTSSSSLQRPYKPTQSTQDIQYLMSESRGKYPKPYNWVLAIKSNYQSFWDSVIKISLQTAFGTTSRGVGSMITIATNGHLTDRRDCQNSDVDILEF